MTLSVLIVGCGNIAGGYETGDGRSIRTHARAFREHGGYRLAACVDPDAGRREAFARRWDLPKSYAGLDEIEDRCFDVISLCSPSALHAEQLELVRGWPTRVVFCEKPLTLDIARSHAIVANYRAAGIGLAVNYQRRWDSSVRQLQDEEWGRLLTATGLYTKGVQTNGSHLIDLAQALLGPLEPEAVTDVVRDFEEYDPTLGAILRTRDGAPVTLSVGDRRLFTIFELDLLFEKGRVTFGDSGYRWCRRRIVDDPRFQGYRSLEAADWQPTGLDSALADAVANLHDFVTCGTPLRSTGDTALAAQKICADLIALAQRKGD